MKIDYLANYQHLIPIVAQWYLDAWRKFSENLSIEHTKLKLAERLNTDKLDVCFLCFNDDCNNELIGTFSLAERYSDHLWYEKLGWKIIKEDIVHKFDIKIMETNL